MQFVINIRRKTGNIAVLLMFGLHKLKISTFYFKFVLRIKNFETYNFEFKPLYLKKMCFVFELGSYLLYITDDV